MSRFDSSRYNTDEKMADTQIIENELDDEMQQTLKKKTDEMSQRLYNFMKDERFMWHICCNDQNPKAVLLKAVLEKNYELIKMFFRDMVAIMLEQGDDKFQFKLKHVWHKTDIVELFKMECGATALMETQDDLTIFRERIRNKCKILSGYFEEKEQKHAQSELNSNVTNIWRNITTRWEADKIQKKYVEIVQNSKYDDYDDFTGDINYKEKVKELQSQIHDCNYLHRVVKLKDSKKQLGFKKMMDISYTKSKILLEKQYKKRKRMLPPAKKARLVHYKIHPKDLF